MSTREMRSCAGKRVSANRRSLAVTFISFGRLVVSGIASLASVGVSSADHARGR